MGYSRTKFIVKPSYQLKLALNLFIYIIAYSIILGFVIFYPLYSELNSTALGIDEQTRLSAMVLYLHKRVWIGLLLVAVLAAVHAIFSSHRVVGPMYRFEQIVDSLVRGDYSARIRIRKKDEFKDMEARLNELAGVLELKRTRDSQFYADMKTRLETISAMLEAEGAQYPEDVKRLMHSIISELSSQRL